MEQLNVKLYEKYRDLKKRRIFEESECNAKVQLEFNKYLSVVEDMLEELQGENSRLRDQVSSLEDCQAEYKKTLMEETQKVKELYSENQRLHNLLPTEEHCNNKMGVVETDPSETSNRDLKDRSLDISHVVASNSIPTIDHLQNNMADGIQHDNHAFMPDCCSKNFSSSGNEKETECAKCVYKMLIESLVGMKFSVEHQKDGFCLSVTHQSTGYSFILTWTRKGDEEIQLSYHVSSLGTIERAALEWMKEDLVFSATMCRTFFDRISRVIGRQT